MTNGSKTGSGRKKVLTWHIHGSYLYYLSQAPHDFYLPVNETRSEGYGGRAGAFPWGDNVIEVPSREVKNIDLDCILFQSKKNYIEDQFEILSDDQLRLPKIYLEHDPPREHPTDTCHIVDDPNVLLVHVTNFNRLMWDSGKTPTCVIDHGVMVPEDARYTGEFDRGLVVVNNILSRGRRLGADVYETVKKNIPLDLVGMNAVSAGGLGEVAHDKLPYFEAQYRFFFNPIRYTSLGLAVCEAMMIGMPVIGLATTEMVTAVENGVTGFVDTDVDGIIEHMQDLLVDRKLAQQLGEAARKYALERFNIQRFAHDWSQAFNLVHDGAVARAMF